jgi:hypothetical protein
VLKFASKKLIVQQPGLISGEVVVGGNHRFSRVQGRAA